MVVTTAEQITAVVANDGTITLPPEVVAKLGLEPGDDLIVVKTGPGQLLLRVWPNLSPAELFERYQITDDEIDINRGIDEAASEAAEAAVRGVRA